MIKDIDTIYKEKSEALAAFRRNQILDVALGLFYKNGYSKTTVSEIASEAGIAKGLVYNYFRSKKDILFAYKERMNVCLAECKSKETPRDCIREFGYLLLSNPADTGYLPPLRIFTTVFMTDDADDTTKENPLYSDFAEEYFAPLFRAGIDAGQFKDGNPSVYASMYWHMLLGYVMDQVRNPAGNFIVPDIDSILSLFE